MIAAKRPAKTMPARSGLVKTERNTEAASSGKPSGGMTPSITVARIIIPIDTHSSAAST